MPQDPNLYGQRPAKKQKRVAALSSSLDFSAQLSSLMSDTGDPNTASARSRPAKERKDDLFRGGKSRSAGKEKPSSGSKLVIKDVKGTEEESQELARARRKMEDKARLYAAMKRGDYVLLLSDTSSLPSVVSAHLRSKSTNGAASFSLGT